MCIVAIPAVAALAGAGATAAGAAGAITAATAASISMGAAAVGGIASAFGAIQQGKAQASQLKFQAAQNRNNAIVARRQSDDAIKRGEVAEEAQRRNTQQIIAKQRVGFAARGIDLGSDNVVETLADSAQFGELDALTVRSNYAREAYGYQVQASNYSASADNDLLGAKNAKTASYITAGTSLLSGASSVAGSYADYKRLGTL